MMEINSRTVLCVGLLLALASTACKDDDSTPADAAGTGGGTTAGTGGASTPMAVATIAGLMGGTVTGTATFVQAGTDVTVTVALTNCVAGKMYATHIHAGTSCDAAMGHWGPTRGEGIPKVMCNGTTGTATLTRKADMPDLTWTVGGDATTNVVGHAFVLHDPDSTTMPPAAMGCGVIAAN